MGKQILDRDTSILRVLKITGTNCGNAECEVISSTFWGGGGKRLVYISNPEVGKTYEKKSIMVPYGYGVNWEAVSTKKL